MSLKNLFRKKPDYVPPFPYSHDPVIKRRQIWENLNKGLLLEDAQKFIHWDTPFSELYKFEEKRIVRGDRTKWYLGKHTILDGYEAHFESMKWVFKPYSNPVSEIYTQFGIDYDGQRIFNYLHKYLAELLGEPTEIDLTQWGDFDLGTIGWKNGKVQICLSAIEIFNVRYQLSIGLINNPNNKSDIGILPRLYIWFCIKFNIDVEI